MSQSDKDTLVDRLRGIYTVPVNDGAGLLNGKDTFTSTFDVPPIHKEAAARIEQLQRELAEALHWKEVYFRSNAEARAPLSASAESKSFGPVARFNSGGNRCDNGEWVRYSAYSALESALSSTAPIIDTARNSSANSPRSDK